MPTRPAIATALSTLNAAGLSPPAGAAEIASTWETTLGDMPDADLHAAVLAHMRDPDRGRFWPTPADIIGRCANRAPAPADTDAEAFDRLVASIRRGDPSTSHMDRDQRAALDRIGLASTWDQRRLPEASIPHRRRDFVAECAKSRTRRAAQLDAPPPPPLRLVTDRGAR
jgi:hypothetical protein